MDEIEINHLLDEAIAELNPWINAISPYYYQIITTFFTEINYYYIHIQKPTAIK